MSGVRWVAKNNYGGSDWDKASVIQQTPDGGYIVGGSSSSNDGDVENNNGKSDYWIIKIDAKGEAIWQKNYGRKKQDELVALKTCTDNGFIVAGSSEIDLHSFNRAKMDYLIVKLDSVGNIKWEKNYGKAKIDRVSSVQLTQDNSYTIAGRSALDRVGGRNEAYNYLIIKLDDSGNIIWEKNYDEAQWDRANFMERTKDDGYIVAGRFKTMEIENGKNIEKYYYSIAKFSGNSKNLEQINFEKLSLQKASPLVEWEKYYGGTENDVAKSIQKTKDKGFIIAGSTKSKDKDIKSNQGLNDYWVIKLDNSGNLEWEETYGGSLEDEASSIIQTKDGGYIVAGTSESSDGDVTKNNGKKDFWVVKLNKKGKLKWEKIYGGSDDDYALSIQQAVDGGFILTGSTSSNDGDIKESNGSTDSWVIKLDNQGNLEWEKTYGGRSRDHASCIQNTNDGGYIFAGTSSSRNKMVESYGAQDGWIIKLDGNGNTEWEKKYGGSYSDFTSSIQQTIDGGYIVAGSTISTDGHIEKHNGGIDYWVFKLDLNGNSEWQKTFGGAGNDGAFSVQQTKEGGYIVAGESDSYNGDVGGNNGGTDYWILKLNNRGELEWEKNYGKEKGDVARAICQTESNGYIIAGESKKAENKNINGGKIKSDILIIKLSTKNK